jgi:hypothetical protein
LPFFERKSDTGSEFYFELKNGKACFLSDGGIYFISPLSNTMRQFIIYFPTAVSCIVLLFWITSQFYPGEYSPYITDQIGFFSFLLPPILGWLANLIITRRRNKVFVGRTVDDLISDARLTYTKREWAEVSRVYLRHYRIVIKWHSSTFITDRGLTLPFVATSYVELKSFLLREVGDRLIEKR